MAKKITHRETDDELITLFYDTTLHQREIGQKLGLTEKQVYKDIKRLIPENDRDQRRRENWGRAKIGKKNPMYKRYGPLHHNFKGRASDNKGYYTVLRPEWYCPSYRGKRVFEHHAVMCEALGLSRIQKGFSVHHIDGDTGNNDLNNLALVTSGGHSRLHGIERGWNIGRCNDYPKRE